MNSAAIHIFISWKFVHRKDHPEAAVWKTALSTPAHRASSPHQSFSLRMLLVIQVRVGTAMRQMGTMKSILRGNGWAPDAESFHFVDQSSASQSEPRGGTSRTANVPVGALAGGKNFFANLVFQRGVGIFG